MRKKSLRSVDVNAKAQASFNAEIQNKVAGTVYYALSFTCMLWWERGAD